MKANLRLTVQELTRPADGFGDAPEAWENVRVEWFKVTPLSGREFIQVQQVQSNISHRGECQYFSGATNGMRLVNSDESRVFNVESVTNRNEGNRLLDWLLVESNG